MQINTTNLLLILLGITLVLCFVLLLMDKKHENFDPVIDAIQSQLQNETPAQLKSTIQTLQQRLIDYGYAPDLNNYVKKTDLSANGGQCNVANANDRDKYISKTDIPSAGPRIDLSQYVKKSSIPPAQVCPPTPTIDLTSYVKKSTIPPNEKCPPCIAPKVKVSAGLCRDCPPAPPCPAPEPCPACNCPAPAPCPTQVKCTKCDEIRYIKVPAIITKTITVDKNGNVVSQKIDSGSTTPGATPGATQSYTKSLLPTISTMPINITTQQIPSTTFPTMSSLIPNITLAQTLDKLRASSTYNETDNDSNGGSYGNGGGGSGSCYGNGTGYPSPDLNSNFNDKYRVRGRNESNFNY